MSSRYPQLADAAWLRSAYVNRGLSWAEIAREIGCSAKSVGNALQRAGIRRDGAPARVESGSARERRTRSELKRLEAREALLDAVQRGVLVCRVARESEIGPLKITASPEALDETAAMLAQEASCDRVNGNGRDV
jgi:hypothetical protein